MAKQDTKIINETKALALDMINNAGSGHPGIAIDIAPLLYTLYNKIMHINPKESNWINRDRLVLSSGHGSSILYSSLHVSGYDLSLEDLKSFRKINSKTPGHPEVDKTPGVDVSTGLLGSGAGNAVGIALAERYYRNLVLESKPKSKLINFNTYCICGEGDLMEGASYEAFSFAGAQKLSKLTVFYIKNKMSSDGETDFTFNEDIIDRFESMHFNVVEAKRNSVEGIVEAIGLSKKSKKPSLIIIDTLIGKDLLGEGSSKVHGGVIDKDDLLQFKTKLKVSQEAFNLSDDIAINKKLNEIRCDKIYKTWLKEYEEVVHDKSQKVIDILEYMKNPEIKLNFEKVDFKFGDDYAEELRISNHKILNLIATKNKFFLGGSADLQNSCKTYLKKTGYNTYLTPLDRNIAFGVREEAMGNILNGMALCSLNVFGSTMLAFSDHAKPAIRMSAMMNLPVNYIFTHDSISIGYDGPTHEPVEQLATLRMIPNLFSFRPADINEVIGSWDFILKNKYASSLVLSKEKLPKLENTNHKYVKYGAYMVRKEKGKLDGIIISSGEDLHLALEVASKLSLNNKEFRVVSMPSMELFLKQHPKYEAQLLPKETQTFVIEASNPLIWSRFATSEKHIFGVESFGKSGSSEDVKNAFGFNCDKIYLKIMSNLEINDELEFL